MITGGRVKAPPMTSSQNILPSSSFHLCHKMFRFLSLAWLSLALICSPAVAVQSPSRAVPGLASAIPKAFPTTSKHTSPTLFQAATPADTTTSYSIHHTRGGSREDENLRSVALRQSMKSMLGFIVLFINLLIVPAKLMSGDWAWRKGWTFLGTWATLHLCINLPMAYHYPALFLMREGASFTPDQPKWDKLPTFLFFLALPVCFLLAPFNTFRWQDTSLSFLPQIPEWLSLVGIGMHCIGYSLFHVVPIHNQYARKNLAPQSNQQIVRSGLYRWVRHPMYSGLLLWQVGFSLFFGSWPSLGMLLVICFALCIRVSMEEAQLKASPKLGKEYQEYTKEVPYRFLPFVF